VRLLHAAATASMDQSVDSMAGVGGQEDITIVDLMASSSLMEDSRALEIHAVGGGLREDEQQHMLVLCLDHCAFSSMLFAF
jgi:hypothetical protein